MSTEVKNLLEKLGVDADTYEKLTSGELKADTIFPRIKDHQKSLLLNDSEWLKALHHQFRNEEIARIRKLIKREFGLSQEDLENKFPDEFIPIAKEKLTNQLINTYKDAGNQQLLTELENARKALMLKEQELERVRNAEIPAIEARYKKETEETKKAIELERYIEKFNLQNPIELVYPAVREALLKDGLDLRLEGRKLILQKPDGTTPMNEEGSQFITLDSYLSKKLRDFGVLKLSNPIDLPQSPVAQPANATGNENALSSVLSSGNSTTSKAKNLMGLEKALEKIMQNDISSNAIYRN
jgi:hypothetical protein